MNRKLWTTVLFLQTLVLAKAEAMPLQTNEFAPSCLQKSTYVAPTDNVGRYVSQRPPKEERLFHSDAIERKIAEVKALLKNPRLAWMFENCFPNTLDTTVHFRIRDGKPDTFVYTGDIHAMWLRDSGAQVWPYIPFANEDPQLKQMLEGVIRRQFLCINIDPYANAFNDGPTGGEWQSDLTDMKPELHERKWEIDSLCYPLRLAYQYWKVTGDASIFDETWLEAVARILQTFREQQRKDGDRGPYRFQRKTERATDTTINDGWGAPVRPVGLIASAFRPSDDATTLPFLVPSNFFAVSSLRKAAEILTAVNKDAVLAEKCNALADEVETALKKYAVCEHSEYGPIYAYEVDGFGGRILMDDANVPSLLAMAYLGDVDEDDPVYQNTRRFVWSEANPYFFRGTAGEGIGGPHIGYDMIWPMSIMMKAFTSRDDAEIKECLRMLMRTDAGTGFMHESFHKDNPSHFTRKWFAWQNTLFGELILKLIDEGKLDLLNSLCYADYVDPYIGSGEHGHVFVGANVPFGMVQAGPQNIHKGWDWCSGYHYSDSILIGFSHTHLSGTGCADLGDVLLMPYTGDVRTRRGEQDNIEGACSSYYSHDKEQVAPGYYSLLMDNGVRAELTTTDRVAIHRYTYPEETPRLLINLKEGNGDKAYETCLRRTDKYTVEGYRFSKGWSPRHKVFFVLKSEQPIERLDVFQDDNSTGQDALEGVGVKGVLTFEGNPRKVQVKVALSSVSCANALANMEAELPAWDFDKVRSSAAARWERILSCIDVESADERGKRVFYTSLYHLFIAPTLYEDVNGAFRGHNDSIYQADKWTNYSTFSLWDTYRAYHPLMTIIQPRLVPDWVNSMLSIYDQQGKLPIWPLVGGETNQMPGYSALPVIADAYMKGFRGFDAERALNYMVASATCEKQRDIPYLLEKGYIPCDKAPEATSVAMEYAVGDWGLARMAKKMGKEDIFRMFQKRGYAYETYFDKRINFIRPKMEDGSWRSPYDPFRSVHGWGDFCEGNGWQYTFFVPQHPEGLIDLMGGDERFVAKLDSLFMAEGDMDEHASSDISGLIGMYAHGNEPSHHVAYLYAYAGQQWKTAEKVDFIQRNFYTDKPDGIIGNEDCGQMSAWHVLSALGFYQVNPSNGVYVFGCPLFEKATIRLPEGKTFEVIANNVGGGNKYIQSVRLNGKAYTKSYITYEDIMRGGTLTFEMGAQPNKDFGTLPEDRPRSLESN